MEPTLDHILDLAERGINAIAPEPVRIVYASPWRAIIGDRTATVAVEHQAAKGRYEVNSGGITYLTWIPTDAQRVADNIIGLYAFRTGHTGDITNDANTIATT